MREYDMCHFEMEHFRARRNEGPTLDQSLSSVLTMVEHQYDTGNSYRRIAEDDGQLRTEWLL